MSLNLRSIAVAGIGFGALAVASQGLITPAQEQWDTAQGVAKNAFVQFKPSQDAEARFTEAVVKCSFTVPIPYAEAYPNILGETGHATHHNVFAVKANGFPTYKVRGGLCVSGAVYPVGDSAAAPFGYNFCAAVAKVHPVGEAVGYAREFASTQSQAGEVYPWGVQNPTDEELIVLTHSVRRGRSWRA